MTHDNPSEPLVTRRDVIKGVTALTLLNGFTIRTISADQPKAMGHKPLAIATWNFGKLAVDQALRELQAGAGTLDAVEHGIRVVEASGGSSVGLTGRPNAAGFVQQDACIMHGPGHLAGSVAGLEGIQHPISAARCVMERTRHVMLVGDGARAFAIKCGLESVPVKDHESKADDWWSHQEFPHRERTIQAPTPGGDGRAPAVNHDTVTLLVLGPDGTISGGCSTSGLADKLPGRVGDSPILGSGLYVDNEVGAAGGTGIGENIMRYCASLLIVEAMRQGAPPAEACRQVIERIVTAEHADKSLDIFFIALDKFGRFGAAGTGDFAHAVAHEGFSEVLTSPAVG